MKEKTTYVMYVINKTIMTNNFWQKLNFSALDLKFMVKMYR